VLLVRSDLEILVYPSDLAMSGARTTVARARAAAATGLIGAPAWLTVSADSQAIEDDIIRASHLSPEAASPLLTNIDHRLATSVIAFDDWETLLRLRLQLQVAADRAEPPGAISPTSPAAIADVRGAQAGMPVRRARLVEWVAALGVAGLLVLDVLLLVIRPGAGTRKDG
jgi:hypothetical protein